MTHDSTEDTVAFDADLMAYADGTLPPDKLAEVESRLARDPTARDAVAQWRHADTLIRAAAHRADDLPANLQIAALERDLARRLTARRWRARLMGPGLRRIAASVVIFAAGWGAHGLFSAQAPFSGGAHPAFLNPSLAGHSAYTQASKVAAEFGPEEIDAALDWMSERMHYKIDSPKLERLGYTIQSARLVVEDETPIAVFYLRNATGEPVTVTMTPQVAGEPDYGLRVVSVADETAAYWTDQRLNYTVVANVDRGMITALAAAVRD